MVAETREQLLDVTGLEPPEPLVRALAAVDALARGEYLHLLLGREPVPLYALLDEGGFLHFGRSGSDSAFEVFIWRRGDGVAENSVADLVGE